MRRRNSSNNWWFYISLPFCLALGIYIGFIRPTEEIRDYLTISGYTDITLRYRVFSGHMSLYCAGKHSVIKSFSAMKNGQVVSGVACYDMLLGVETWED